MGMLDFTTKPMVLHQNLLIFLYIRVWRNGRDNGRGSRQFILFPAYFMCFLCGKHSILEV
jgi:hypothetical protein